MSSIHPDSPGSQSCAWVSKNPDSLNNTLNIYHRSFSLPHILVEKRMEITLSANCSAEQLNQEAAKSHWQRRRWSLDEQGARAWGCWTYHKVQARSRDSGCLCWGDLSEAEETLREEVRKEISESTNWNQCLHQVRLTRLAEPSGDRQGQCPGQPALYGLC